MRDSEGLGEALTQRARGAVAALLAREGLGLASIIAFTTLSPASTTQARSSFSSSPARSVTVTLTVYRCHDPSL